jgi:beta-lactamase class A
MRLFGRDEEYEDEEDVEEEEKKKIKIRDLKPENKRKRKEPPKPWGRPERLLVLGVLLFTVLVASFLALSARNWKLPHLPKLSFSLPQFSSKTFIIEGGKVDRESADVAKNNFKDLTISLSGVYALDVVRLENNFEYGVNEAQVMQAASLIKLPVLALLYQEAEKGTVDLDAKYTLKNSDKREGSGSLINKPAGTQITYRELARLMGNQSDNTAFNIIRNLFGDDKINKVITEIGMKDTSLKENETTPSDIALFFKKLWNGEIINNSHKEEILGYLTNTIYENWIVAGIPDVRVAHKYGREVHVINDAGIVMTDKPFVLVLMTDGIIEGEGDKVIPQLAKMIYNIEKVR